MGYFPDLEQVPERVLARVRAVAGLPEDVLAAAAGRSAERYRSWIGEYLGLVHDPARAREIAVAAMEEAAPVRASVVDLVNVALEELVRAGLELPGFSTLDRMAASVRTRVEGEICTGIAARVGAARERLAGLLVVPDGERRSPFDVVKEPGRRATWSRFRQHGERVDLVDGFGDAARWVEGVAAAKVSAFAEQARVLSVGEMLDVSEPRRTALLACTVAKARARVRDEFVVMLSKRMARHGKRAQEELADLEQRHKASTEQLLVAYRDVLTVLKEHVVDERADRAGQVSLGDALAVKRIREVVETGGGFDAQLAEIEALSAYRGGNWTPLVERFFRPDRPTMFKLARMLTFVATSRDRSVLDALRHALAHQHLTRELIPDTIVAPTAPAGGEAPEPGVLDLSFASAQWRTTVYAKDRPGMLVRRHFEAMVFTYLVEELRCGDIAVVGAEDFGDWTTMLLPWERVESQIPAICEQAGIPSTADAFVDSLKRQLTQAADQVDAGYPDNAELTIDPLAGMPSLKQRQGRERTASAAALEAELDQRLPARGILEHLARAAHWTGWWYRLGPLSGSDPKLKDPLARYVVTAFTYGSGLGATQAARHMNTVAAHELAAIAKRHCTAKNLARAGADVVDAHLDLDLVRAWGDGSVAAVDGTMMDAAVDNLLAETSIRYGGYGGIAHHLVADTYVALFSRFVPCGVWEAVYLIDSLLQNQSRARPEQVHADTQGQSFPVFGLAHVLGIDLLPRIRNFQDLTFHRPDPNVRYRHIDPLFSTDPRTAVDWELIRRHWPDLMQVALSIKQCPRTRVSGPGKIFVKPGCATVRR
ncbi:Tn3 family transposase [Streptomyces sp. NPDC001817]|uniref:Tn3 family transposase n=1 Tax=Streptomyces sp. NPDC001817 TaxID=3154398 RepID=UPI00331B803E